MRFTIVTLFPEFFDSPLACGLMGKALEAGRVRVDTVNPRDFTEDRHRTVDDRPYGGGPGMVMQPEPLDRALRSIDRPGRMLLLTPRGRPLTQELARELAGEQDLTVVCGRYEGIDARIEQAWPVEPVSVGDFVLNGGEAGALCLLEAVGRLVPEFMGHQDSGEEESFSRGLLEYPHYTRPETWQGMGVPDVLLSGDHGAVAAWRRRAALRTTLQRRPDLLAAAELDSEDLATLRRGEAKRESGSRPAGNLYLALLHHPVFNKEGNILTVSLTNLDIHDIARCSRSFDLGGY
jgi:tRNA (guanine37-N1)-methyltransferase